MRPSLAAVCWNLGSEGHRVWKGSQGSRGGSSAKETVSVCRASRSTHRSPSRKGSEVRRDQRSGAKDRKPDQAWEKQREPVAEGRPGQGLEGCGAVGQVRPASPGLEVGESRDRDSLPPPTLSTSLPGGGPRVPGGRGRSGRTALHRAPPQSPAPTWPARGRVLPRARLGGTLVQPRRWRSGELLSGVQRETEGRGP